MALSVAIVCRNNDATIGRTLESVAGLAAEIVAVDSGSMDGTIPLLEKHGARIIRTEWKGHVATKQMALEACTQDWVLCLDSDESPEPELKQSIDRAIERPDPAIDGYEVNRKVWYRDRPLNFAWQPERRLRLVRRGRARWTGLDPHDRLELVAPAVTPPLLSGDLRHDSISTFPEFLAKQAQHARTMAASMHREGQRGSYLKLLTSPPGALFKQLVIKQAWRDGWPGWLAAGATSAASLMKHMALIEVSRGRGQPANAPGQVLSVARAPNIDPPETSAYYSPLKSPVFPLDSPRDQPNRRLGVSRPLSARLEGDVSRPGPRFAAPNVLHPSRSALRSGGAAHG